MKSRPPMNADHTRPVALDSRPSTLESASPARTRRSTLDLRRLWPTLLLSAPFAACILGSWAWFNTSIGTGRSTLDPGRPAGVWLTARTNIPGYIFVPEPVSDSVKKTLGTTNILSGSFYKIADNSTALGLRFPLKQPPVSAEAASGARPPFSGLPPSDLARLLKFRADLA